KHLEQFRDAGLDEMNARGFERLEESAREPERDDGLVPCFLAPAGREAQKVWLSERAAVEIREQRRCGFVVADVFARVHVTVTGSMLQRNAPLPAGRACGRACIRCRRAGLLARHGERAIARQPTCVAEIAG